MSVFEQSLVWWERLHHSEHFDRWLARSRARAALFACNDTVGLKAAAAARRLGLEIPGDIAILGVDNEDILCELSVPPLSSIALDLERVGWLAAEALAAFMDGPRDGAQKWWCPHARSWTRVHPDARHGRRSRGPRVAAIHGAAAGRSP